MSRSSGSAVSIRVSPSARPTTWGEVQVEDIIFLVRNNPKMYSRIRELITMNVELKKARKAFDDIKYAQDAS